VTESYDRSYGGMVRAQQLTELEEVIEYAELGAKLKLSSPEDAHAGNGGGGYGGKTTNFELGGGVSGGVVRPSDARFGAFSATANVGDARSAATRRELMRKMWRERIHGVQRNVEVWQALLAVRSLVLPMHEETETWLKFASLNRKAGRTRQARRTLLTLLEYDPIECAPGTGGYGAGSGRPDVMLAYVKHQWALGNRRDAFSRLQSLVGELR
jgi:FKBP12-rapamycin complex-associated protein